jgi:hypothetical protein
MFISHDPLPISRYALVAHSCGNKSFCSATGGAEGCLIVVGIGVLSLWVCPVEFKVSRLATLAGLPSSCSGCFLFTWRSRKSRRENVVRHGRHANEASPFGRVWRSECRLRFSWRVNRLWQTLHSKGCSLPAPEMVVIVTLGEMSVRCPRPKISGTEHDGRSHAMQRPRGHRELKATIAAIKGQKGRNESRPDRYLISPRYDWQRTKA